MFQRRRIYFIFVFTLSASTGGRNATEQIKCRNGDDIIQYTQ